MFVLYLVITVVFWPQLAEAADWVRRLWNRRSIRDQARAACEGLDLEYELLLLTPR